MIRKPQSPHAHDITLQPCCRLPTVRTCRFTLDTTNYLKAMRLFVGSPVWTPYNRVDAATDELPQRKKYSGAVTGATTDAPSGGAGAPAVAVASA